jgi:hypothetical protein
MHVGKCRRKMSTKLHEGEEAQHTRKKPNILVINI